MVEKQKKMKEICVNLLEKRGVTLDRVVDIVYDLQKKYIPEITKELCLSAVNRVLDKREVQNAIVTGVELDMLAEKRCYQSHFRLWLVKTIHCMVLMKF